MDGREEAAAAAGRFPRGAPPAALPRARSRFSSPRTTPTVAWGAYPPSGVGPRDRPRGLARPERAQTRPIQNSLVFFLSLLLTRARVQRRVVVDVRVSKGAAGHSVPADADGGEGADLCVRGEETEGALASGIDRRPERERAVRPRRAWRPRQARSRRACTPGLTGWSPTYPHRVRGGRHAALRSRGAVPNCAAENGRCPRPLTAADNSFTCENSSNSWASVTSLSRSPT